MSDSETDDGGGLLGGILWGNLGDNDQLEVDYLDQGAIRALGNVNKLSGLGNDQDLQRLKASQPSSAATLAGESVSHATDAQDYEDEPTLPEDLEDEELAELRLQQPAAAALGAAHAGAIAAASHLAGEDDYDDGAPAGVAAPKPAVAAINPAVAAAAAAIAAQRSLTAEEDDYDTEHAAANSTAAAPVAWLQVPGSPAPAGASAAAASAYASLLQAQQLHLNIQQQQQQVQQQQQADAALVSGRFLSSLQSQQPVMTQQQQPSRQPPPQQQQQQEVIDLTISQPAAAAAVPPAPAAPPKPALTPEQERKRALIRATPYQEAIQLGRNFLYLDLDEGGEDIVHFSELFAPSDNSLRTSYIDALGKTDSQHVAAVEKARNSSEASRYHQLLVLRNYITEDEQQQQLSYEQLQQLMAEHEVEQGDEALFGNDADAVRLATLQVKDTVEELSDAEEELFVNPAGLGRAMIRAAKVNAAAAAVSAAAEAAAAAATKRTATATTPEATSTKAAAAAAGFKDATADAHAELSASQSRLANPYGLEALDTGILPEWESGIDWGANRIYKVDGSTMCRRSGTKGVHNAAAAAAAAAVAAAAAALQAQQQQQQQQQLPGLGSMLSGAGSALPGAGSVLPGTSASGLPPPSSSGLPPHNIASGEVLPIAGSAVLPGMPGSSLPSGSVGMSQQLSIAQSGMLSGAGSMLTVMSGAASALPGSKSEMHPRGSVATGGASGATDATADAAAAAAVAAAAAAPVPAGAGAVAAAAAAGRAKGGKDTKHSARGPFSKPHKPLAATLLELKTNRHMLRLMPPISAAAAAAGAATSDAGDQAAAAAAAAGDRAAAAALAPTRVWGNSNTNGRLGQGITRGSGGHQQAGGPDTDAAAAAEQLKIKHVPELLAQEFRPVLPDSDWLADVVWDKEQLASEAAEKAAAAAAGEVEDLNVSRQGQAAQQKQQLEKQLPGLDKAQQQQQMINNGQLVPLAGLGRHARVLWDLNDPHMVFEAHNTSQYSNASAVMQQAVPKAVPLLPPHLMQEQDPALRDLAPLHISRDHLYSAGDRQTGRATGTGKHTKMAQEFQFNLIPTIPRDAFGRGWHRPRQWWSAALLLYNLAQRQRHRDVGRSAGKGLKFETYSLTLRKGKFATAPDGEADLAEVWQVVSQIKSFKDACASEMPKLYGPGPNFDVIGVGDWLDLNKTLRELGFNAGVNFMIPVWSQVQPLRTAAVGGLLPPDVPCRPPAAFKKPKDLSAGTPGHLLLLEYMEERPLLLLQPGMGLRLTTYYRRKNESDLHYQALQAEYSEGLLNRQALPLTSSDRYDARPPWMVGTPQLLTPDDTSPFYELAPIPPGEMQFAVDTPCFRAPAVPHVVSATDFLLVRSAAGLLALRELTGAVAVGQQHPSMLIWAPFSTEAQNYEVKRFKAHVARLLKSRMDKPNVKAGKAVASVTVTELAAAFEGMSIACGGDRTRIVNLLQECSCVPLPEKPDHWVVAPNAKLPAEQDMRKEVTPDMAVQYEALLAGMGVRNVCGVGADSVQAALDATGGPAHATLSLVLDMLMPDEGGKQAAAAVEQCVLLTPWGQAAAYHQALRESRNTTALMLKGRGDPTGRGRGFAYIREDPKVAKQEAAPPPGVKAKDDGTITGTDADLRRLGHKRAGEILVTKFNMSPEEVNALARWDRIDVIRRNVRDPAWAAVVNADPELLQYVRNVKLSAEDQKAKMRNLAAPVFAAQMNALHEPWNEDALSEDISWGVNPILAGGPDALTDTAASGAAAGVAGAGTGGFPSLASLLPGQEVDMGMSYRGPKPALRGRHEAIAGERRIRRTITYTLGNGAKVRRTVLVTGREDIAALNLLYRRTEGFGEQHIGGKGATKARVVRMHPLGCPWVPELRPISMELPPEPPGPPSAAAAAAQAQATAAATAPALVATDSWAGYPEDAAAASQTHAGAGYNQPMDDQAAALYLQQQQYAAQQQAAQAAAARVKKPTAAQLKKQREAAAKAAREAARAKKRGRRRADDYEFSEEEDSEFTGSESDGEDAIEVSDDDSPKQQRAKRPRAAAAGAGAAVAAAGDGVTPAAAAAAPAPAFAAAPPPPPDSAPGAASGASPWLLAALRELNHRFGTVAEGMIKHQANKSRMGPFKGTFENPVPLSLVPDYLQFVPPEKQMWLRKIKERTARNFYSNRREFLADCKLLVDAARAYNTLGSGGRLATPQLINYAQGVYDEGQKLVGAAEALDYWEKRVAIERTRQQGPQAWQALLGNALAEAAKDPDNPPSCWQWFECDACHQWRLLTDTAIYELRLDAPESKFLCGENTDRPNGLGCQEPPEWRD